MKKNIFLFTLLAALMLSQSAISQISTYRKINEEGIANIVFSNDAISKGEESASNLKTEFTADETIFARAYFPKTISSYGLKTDEKIIVIAYVDNKQVDRVYITPKAEWNQMQVYVMNTGDDDFSRLAGELYYMDSGEHNLIISVGLQRYGHMETVIKDDGTITEQKVDKVDVISQSEIKIIVE